MKTTARPQTKPRQGLPRASHACLSCRAAKSKCDGVIPGDVVLGLAGGSNPPSELGSCDPEGASKASSYQSRDGYTKDHDAVPAEVPCTRCARLSLSCSWRPCMRLGRPPKRRLISADNDRSTSLRRSAMSLQDMSAPTPAGEGTSDATQCNLHLCGAMETFEGICGTSEDRQPCPVSEQPDETTRNGDFLTNVNFDSIFEGLDVSFDHNSTLPTSSWSDSVATAHGPEGFSALRQRISGILRVDTTSSDKHTTQALSESGEFIRDDIIALGLQRYRASLGLSNSLGKTQSCAGDNFSEDLCFLSAAAALGHLLFEGVESSSYERCRERSMKLTCDEWPTNLSSALDRIAGLVLVVYADHGANDLVAAEQHMILIRTLVLQFQSGFLEAQIGLEYGGERCQRARCVWSEVFALDVILNVATSGRVERRLRDVQEKFRALEPKEESASKIRHNAISLLASIFAEPASRQSSVQIAALDTMLCNSIARTQTYWAALGVSAKLKASPKYDGDAMGTREHFTLMQSMLMLNAARVHLHRRAFFADATSDLTSCSFARLEDANDFGGDTSTSYPDRKALQYSVNCIKESSEAILHLMRLDAEVHFSRLEATLLSGRCDDGAMLEKGVALIPPHWPFAGCCQMVAAYGCFIAAAATSSSVCKSLADEQIGEGSNTARSHISTDIDVSLAANSDTWSLRRNISDIGFCESTLSVTARVWKISSNYRDEVHRCRLAIEQAIW